MKFTIMKINLSSLFKCALEVKFSKKLKRKKFLKEKLRVLSNKF